MIRLVTLVATLLPIHAVHGQGAQLQHRLHDGLVMLQARNFDGVVGAALPGYEPVFRATGFTRRIAKRHPERVQVDIGSITKTITAAAIMRLADEGRVSMSQTLAEFFGDVPADKNGITIRQLLTHTAGFKTAVGRDAEVLLKDAFLERALNSRLISEPGTRYGYSNVGYSLLAAVVEAVSGMTFEDYVEDGLLADHGDLTFGYVNVFDPIKSMRTNPGEHIARASWGHAQPYWNLIGSGGMVSTAESMLEFVGRLDNGEIVSREALELMRTPSVVELPDRTRFGFGTVIEDDPGFGRIYWHNGGNGRFSAHWAHYADHGIRIFTAGTGSPDASRAAGWLAECLLGDPSSCQR